MGKNKIGKNIENNKEICPHGTYTCWGPQGSINPEYGSKLRTLHVYACICIFEACERCLLMEFSVMKIIEVDFVVV